MNPATLTILDALMRLAEDGSPIDVTTLLGLDVVREIHPIDIRRSLTELQDAGHVRLQIGPRSSDEGVPDELTDILEIALLQ